MPWNKVDMQEERIRFVVLAERGEREMAELCREFGISRATGYKWWRRYQKQGVTRGAQSEAARKPATHGDRHRATDRGAAPQDAGLGSA